MAVRRKRRRRGKGRPRPPTARQKEILAELAALTRQIGRAPNAKELGAHLGITRHGARLILKRLEAAGHVQDVPKTISSGQWALTTEGLAAIEE